MQTVTRSVFTTVKTEGGLLPPDLLQRIADGRDLPGLKPQHYHLAPSERLNEVISRSWSRCLSVWQAFVRSRAELADSEAGTTLTRERWLLILFDELGYGRLPALRSPLALPDGETYSISHLWNDLVPIHLVTFRQDLDRRSEVRTALRKTPHGLMQELLNRSPRHQWGIISNGLTLRLLHDNAALRRAAYVEFDLAAIFGGEIYAEFALLWLLCHQSRFEPRTPGPAPAPAAEPVRKPQPKAAAKGGEDEEEGEAEEAQPEAEPCWLDLWQKSAAEQGTRALDALRDGVAEAIGALGEGFLKQPNNGALRARLQSGELSRQDFYRQLRRLTYRLIFLFVAEDRDLLFAPNTDLAARTCYDRFYSLRRLRARAGTQRGGPHPDLYRQLRLLFTLLREGYPPLGLPGLGSMLFSDRSTPDLDGADLANEALLAAVRALTFTRQNSVRRQVDYRNLDTEELGSVYESLLELHPELNVDARTFALSTGAGSERKTTGSHYTPTSLVESLLDSALEPVVADRLKAAGKQPAAREAALLNIKVLDYAAGSGHMLIGAGRRLATHLAAIRAGEEEPTPSLWRHAMRDVVRHCLYAVDLNDMAVELCKVALWMESMEPGKPLSFLDAHVQQGNSLIGVTPGLDIGAIPDDAFTARTGDDKTTAAALKKRNKKEREGHLSFDLVAQTQATEGDPLAASRLRKKEAVEARAEESAEAVRAKEEAYLAWRKSREYQLSKQAAHLWTAAFFWPLHAGDTTYAAAPTQRILDAIRAPQPETALKQHADLLRKVNALAKANHFFHWEVEFPEVFARPERGFDVVLSNPPWERIKLQEKEWFAVRAPGIASAPNAAARKAMIESLKKDDPALHADFQDDLRAAESESHLIRNSGKYPLCGRGDVNTYAVFAELARQVVGTTGRTGVIVPTGIATDDTTKFYFQEIMETGTLASLYDFENRRKIFPGVHRSYKFCLLTLRGSTPATSVSAEFVFFALDVRDLLEKERQFTLTAQEIALLNPNTRTCPIFRSKRDAELTKGIYRRVPVLIEEGPPEVNPWGVSFLRMFDMSNDSHLFRTRAQLEAEGWRLEGNRFVRGAEVYLPLYEGRLGHQLNHRFATEPRGVLREVTEREVLNPHFSVESHFFVPAAEFHNRVTRRANSCVTAQLGHRRVSSNTNERTVVASILPWLPASYGWILSTGPASSAICLLASCYNSFAFDYLLRNSLSQPSIPQGTFQQIPTPPPDKFAQSGKTFIEMRVLELTYTAWDLEAFAQDCGYDGPPFRWDDERRFWLRAELDAAYFHLYGIARDDVEYIMETFPIVKRKDMTRHGSYRTKEAILGIYDEMAEAARAGVPYATRLDPPPADPRVAHPPRATLKAAELPNT